MLGSTALNAEMADCWKLVWNVEPAALMVPLAELLDEDPAAGVVLVPLEPDEELDEEHAARASATTAKPAVVSCLLRRRCISGYSLQVLSVLRQQRAARKAGQPANRGVRVQFVGVVSTRGQMRNGQKVSRDLSSRDLGYGPCRWATTGSRRVRKARRAGCLRIGAVRGGRRPTRRGSVH